MACNCNTTLGNVKFHRENCTQLLAQQFGSRRELHRKDAEIAELVALVKRGREFAKAMRLVQKMLGKNHEDPDLETNAYLAETEKYANG